MRSIKEIFSRKDLSRYDINYDCFINAKEVYIKDSSEDNYLNMILAFAAFDSDLKMILNSGTITVQEYRCIKEKLKEGLY